MLIDAIDFIEAIDLIGAIDMIDAVHGCTIFVQSYKGFG